MRLEELIYRQEAYDINGACMEVYRTLGNGFLETVYQECLEIEFELQKLPAVPQPRLELSYKGRPLQQKYVPDFICYSKIVVELKAVSALTDEHRAQVQNQLRATGHRLGLLINFGHFPGLEHERIVL